MPSRSRTAKIDPLCEAAVEFAREVALEAAGVMGVGDHLGCRAEGERVASHLFACPHPGYRGWQWSVTLARASRAKTVTVNEVVLLPGPARCGPHPGCRGPIGFNRATSRPE
jgi:hypothetical protein